MLDTLVAEVRNRSSYTNLVRAVKAQTSIIARLGSVINHLHEKVDEGGAALAAGQAGTNPIGTGTQRGGQIPVISYHALTAPHGHHPSPCKPMPAA